MERRGTDRLPREGRAQRVSKLWTYYYVCIDCSHVKEEKVLKEGWFSGSSRRDSSDDSSSSSWSSGGGSSSGGSWGGGRSGGGGASTRF